MWYIQIENILTTRKSSGSVHCLILYALSPNVCAYNLSAKLTSKTLSSEMKNYATFNIRFFCDVFTVQDVNGRVISLSISP